MAPAVTSTASLVKQSGNSNGTNTANAMYEDPCFSSNLPGCDGSTLGVSGQENTSCSKAGGFYSSGLLNFTITIGARQSQWTWWTGQTTGGPANSCAYHASCTATCANTGDTRFIVGTDWPGSCPTYESCSDTVFTINGVTTCVPGAKLCGPSTTGPNGPCS